LLAVYGRGEIRIQRFSIKRPVAAAAAAATATLPTPADAAPASAAVALATDNQGLERTRV
jgi:hypothetical protein